MIRTINPVKREIRILGLDFCNRHRITGVISRGGNYLDGVFALQDKGEIDSQSIARSIRTIRHYPELRGIMVHDPRRRSVPNVIEDVTRLPVVEVSEKNPGQAGFKPLRVKQGKLWIRTRLDSQTISRVLQPTWTIGSLPEPVRVAHLLAQARIPKTSTRP